MSLIDLTKGVSGILPPEHGGGASGTLGVVTITPTFGQATITLDAIPDSGSIDIDWNASGSPQTVQWNDSEGTIQAAINSLTGIGGGVTVVGDFTTGLLITFTGVLLTAPMPSFSFSNNTLLNGATPVNPSTNNTVEPDQTFTLTTADFGKLISIADGPVYINTPDASVNSGAYFFFKNKSAYSITINYLTADLAANSAGMYASDGTNFYLPIAVWP